MARIVSNTRAARRVFAKKARTNIKELRHQFMLRGGGYL